MLKILNRFSTSKVFQHHQIQNFLLQATNQPNSLTKITQKFANQGIQMTYIKSKLYNTLKGLKRYEIQISSEKANEQQILALKKDLDLMGVKMEKAESIKVPWFPTNIDELDRINIQLLDEHSQPHNEHSSQEMERRSIIQKIACEYRVGDPIPNIEYTSIQSQTWRKMYEQLRCLHKQTMCKLYEVKMQQLEKQLSLNKNVPQLNNLSQYLEGKTGFRLKPINRPLTQREFLNCFAHKVICCAQYLRFSSKMEHSSEPDAIHGIIGHIPLLADPEVAEMCHWIGILSLGANNQQISELASLYWHTLQFGVCRQQEQFRGYGAGIASSIKQMQNLKSENAKFQKLSPFQDSSVKYNFEELQTSYRTSESLQQCFQEVRKFGESLLKPFFISINPVNGQIFCDRSIERV